MRVVTSVFDFINGETVSFCLFFIGVFGLTARRNIIKSIIAVGIMQTAVILYFVTINYQPGSLPPIGDPALQVLTADPLPHALMITDIVIGVGVTAASLTMFIHMYHKYGTTNWLKAMKKRGK